MEITVTGRHFTLTHAERQRATDLIHAHFADLPLKLIGAAVILDKQGKMFTAEVVVNAKDALTAKAAVEDFELMKALDAAVQKAFVQVEKYLEKRKHHKNGETLVQLEEKIAAAG
ncbi:MAG: HPF/RaiA family ribosome-associated protein [Lentisphaeria bacterium]|nr:HPF/RaiA family ribosome-associated protein [Lentisphaeria bacterium]